MYSPSPPPVAASNAYVYLNHHQQLASNPYASRTQSHPVGGLGNAASLNDMSLVGGVASANGAGSAGAPPSASYGHASQLGATRYDNANMSWMSRYPARQAHLAQGASGASSLASLPPSLGHAVSAGVPSSPGYSAAMASSPHLMMATGMSPATPRTQPRASAASSTVGTSPEWQQQMYCAEISRQSFSPHHHARAAALAARSSVSAGQDPKKSIQLPAGAAANGLSFPLAPDAGKAGDESISGISASPSKPAGLRTASSKSDEGDAEQSWSIIDMGGLNLKNIGLEVFRYTFLTSLFINHNSLTTLSPAIVQLRNLSILDASGNKLVMIPPELGMLTELKALFLFDNCLTVLPPELGTLYQLEMLGIEGNPLQENLLSIIQHDGTPALIAFLRDSCPVSVPPPEREWIAIETDVPSGENDTETTFAVLSYNVLCEKYATPQMYGYTPGWALVWDYRKEFILQEIMSYSADICCLQEVEMGQYEEYFEPKLKQSDYEGIFWPKSRARTMREDERRHVDGCATFFNSRIFRLVDKQLIEFNQIALQRPDFKKTEDIFNRVMTKDNVAAIAMLEHRATGAKLLVANAHMHWDPEFRDVKLVQSAMLMEQLESIGNRFAKMAPQTKLENGASPPKYASGKQIPMVICGDFNSTPDSGVYEFLSQGETPPDHQDFMDHTYGTYTSEGLRHDYALRSAYHNIGELPITNYTPGFRGAIDYIWYSSNTLANSGLLGEVDPAYLARVVGFPNAHFPSEYVALLTQPCMYPGRIQGQAPQARVQPLADARAPVEVAHTPVVARSFLATALPTSSYVHAALTDTPRVRMRLARKEVAHRDAVQRIPRHTVGRGARKQRQKPRRVPRIKRRHELRKPRVRLVVMHTLQLVRDREARRRPAGRQRTLFRRSREKQHRDAAAHALRGERGRDAAHSVRHAPRRVRHVRRGRPRGGHRRGVRPVREEAQRRVVRVRIAQVQTRHVRVHHRDARGRRRVQQRKRQRRAFVGAQPFGARHIREHGLVCAGGHMHPRGRVSRDLERARDGPALRRRGRGSREERRADVTDEHDERAAMRGTQRVRERYGHLAWGAAYVLVVVRLESVSRRARVRPRRVLVHRARRAPPGPGRDAPRKHRHHVSHMQGGAASAPGPRGARREFSLVQRSVVRGSGSRRLPHLEAPAFS